MYICKKCNATFEEPAKQYDSVGYKYDMCPYCEDDEISIAVPCQQCSEPKPNDFEPFCDSCKINIRKDIYEFIHDMQVVAGWDKELLDDMLTEYLEG